jgi:hypothetical protein
LRNIKILIIRIKKANLKHYPKIKKFLMSIGKIQKLFGKNKILNEKENLYELLQLKY